MIPGFSGGLTDALEVFRGLARQERVFATIADATVETLRGGGTVYTCGNGGSAADALHLAEELVGRYKQDRPARAAVCLNADPTLLTCIANDYGFEQVFARQVAGLARRGDLLVCFSTSGRSPNVLEALRAARRQGVRTVALLGKDGGPARTEADLALVVESADTARVQEAHTFLLHALLEAVETALGTS